MRLFRRFVLVLVFFFFLAFPKSTLAADFTNDYKVEYFLDDSTQGELKTHVKFTITLTNQRSDVYVKKISLAFPKSFEISDIKASDNKGPIKPEVVVDDRKINFGLSFTDPAIGKGTVNSFALEFDQKNLFKVNGNVWEVILPTMEDKTRSSYEVLVHLPQGTSKKISISKPIPTEIQGTTIKWVNPKVKTISAVFGNEQFFQSKLTYHITNPKLGPVYTDVAFPPDTQFQKVYVNSISPKPDRILLDEDGNYLGRYYLKPKEKKDIVFNGVIELLTTPREEVKPYISQLFSSQKSYLLTQKSYWELPQDVNASKLQSAEDIYRFVVNTFTYNYGRINKDIQRLGATQALAHPDQAVCVEFTDTFVALAREKGIYSREVQGYGFSNDPQLRPLSMVSDILHSWPEYYDERSEVWTPVDPTWENTSGIDYFSSFDLNHIVFAIHGKRPDYPLPAGSYKYEDTRDIDITTVSTQPVETSRIMIEPFKLPTQITDNKTYMLKLIVFNDSNVYSYDVPVKITSDQLSFSEPSFIIPALAPGEKREMDISYKSLLSNKKANAQFKIQIMGNEVYTGSLVILPYYYDIGLKVAYVIGILSAILFAFALLRRFLRSRSLHSG